MGQSGDDGHPFGSMGGSLVNNLEISMAGHWTRDFCICFL